MEEEQIDKNKLKLKFSILTIKILFLFGAIFFIFSSFVTYYGLQVLGKDLSHMKWSRANGHVILSKIVSRKEGNSERYGVEVYYKYAVDDQKYIGVNFTPLELGSGSQRQAEYFVKKYPAGEGVIVYYNYRNPKESILQAGLTIDSFLILVAGIVFCLLIILWFVALNKKKIKLERELTY